MADWPCEAYGEAGLDVGARCFRAAELGARLCADAGECAALMGDERRRVFRRIQEWAAEGDPVAGLLAEDFPTPESLLGGEEDRPPPD